MLKKYYVKKFIKAIDPDFRLEIGNQFNVDIEEEIIQVSFKKNTIEEKMFMNFVEERYGYGFNPFVLSLLHEIGHIMTNSEELQDDRDFEYGCLMAVYNNGGYTEEELNKHYFLIPAELQATDWAVEFYKRNRQLCGRLAMKI